MFYFDLMCCAIRDRGLCPFNPNHWEMCVSVSVHVKMKALVPSMMNMKILILHQTVTQIISCLMASTQ